MTKGLKYRQTSSPDFNGLKILYKPFLLNAEIESTNRFNVSQGQGGEKTPGRNSLTGISTTNESVRCPQVCDAAGHRAGDE